MADLLLTHGYFLSEDEKEQQIMKPYPPLGLLSLSAYLKTHGYSVDVYDSTFGTKPELLRRFQESTGGVVGIYTNLITRRTVLRNHCRGAKVRLDCDSGRSGERELSRGVSPRRRGCHRHRRRRSGVG